MCAVCQNEVHELARMKRIEVYDSTHQEEEGT